MSRTSALFKKVCTDNQYTEAFEAGFSKDFLKEEEDLDVLQYISEHYSKYSKAPSFDRLKEHFPTYHFDSTNDSVEEVVSDLRDDTLYKNVFSLVFEGAKKLKEGKTPEQLRMKGREAFQQLRMEMLSLEADFNPSQDLAINSTAFVVQFWKDYDKRAASDGVLGIPSPWKTYNKATQGSNEGDLTMVVARNGVGKTWITLAMCNHAWQEGAGLLLVSNEIQLMKMANRMVSQKSGISYDSIKTAKLNALGEKEQLADMLEKFAVTENDFIVSGSDDDMSAGGVAAVEAKINKYKPDIVFVDGAYLLSDDLGAKASHERAGNIIRGLKKLAKRRKIPITISWQFNRQASNKSGDSSHIGMTDVAGQDADVIIALFQTEDMKLNKELTIKSLKVREGAPFEFKINWDFSNMDFSELESYEDCDDDDEEEEQEPTGIIDF